MDQRLEAIIARVPGWQGASDLTVRPLGGGITNENYRVDCQGESFVLRLAGANSELLGINRQNEVAANRAAAAIGVAPQVVAFLPLEGILITRFLEAPPIREEKMRQPQTIRRIAETLRQVHALAPIAGHFSAFEVVRTYAERAQEHGVRIPASYQPMLQEADRLQAACAVRPLAPCPCHNDLLSGNFLDDGQIRILDWEYAGMGDPYFDLANLAMNNHFDDSNDELLLRAYWGSLTEGRFARLRLMKAMSDFREAMWGVLQQGISKLDFDFTGYAEKHFARMQETVSDQRWRHWLQEVIDGS
jgi:thiamine kinase-like enzyme